MTLFNKIRHSLSLRLLLLFVAAGIILGIVFQVMLGIAISSHIKAKSTPHLNQYLSYIQQDLGFPPSIEKAKQLASKLPIEVSITTPEASWSTTSNTPEVTHLSPYPYNKYPSQAVRLGFERGQTTVEIVEGDSTVTLWTNPRKESKKTGNSLLFGLGFLLLTLAVLYWFIRRLFRPIQTIRHSVQKIGSGDLSQRIPKLRNDELGELAGTINHMADDIEQMLEAKRELLLAISHELRSPLTRAKVSTELLDDSPIQTDIARDLREMENMISELLEAERLKGQHQQLQKVDVSLNEVVMSVVDEYFPDAELNLQLDEELHTQAVDPVRLRLVVRNILDNALKHQDEGAPPVKLSTRSAPEMTQIQIQDHGKGIPQTHIPHLTEAFYRVDTSRQRKTGGVGLGLYLVKRIMDAHQGQLTIESQEGQGTTVTLSLPA